MNQKGFLNLILILTMITILGLVTGIYFFTMNKNSGDNTQSSFNDSVKTPIKIVDEARDKYAEAQKKYQSDLYTLFISKWPEFKPLIKTNFDLQVALVDSRTMKFYYLLEHNPIKIVRNKGVSAFANFEWTDADNKILRETSPNFANLDDQIKELKASSDGNPMWSEFRKRFQSIMNNKEYLSIINTFNETISSVEQLLIDKN